MQILKRQQCAYRTVKEGLSRQKTDADLMRSVLSPQAQQAVQSLAVAGQAYQPVVAVAAVVTACFCSELPTACCSSAVEQQWQGSEQRNP